MLNFIFTKTPLFLLTQSFWRDEAFSYLLAKRNVLDILLLTAKDFNPPLYYVVLHFWMKIFGHSEIALRSLSLIFYWATIYIAFLFLTEVLKIEIKKSLVYLVLLIVSPILLRYAFEARMYTMFAFFSTLSFFSLYKKNTKAYFISTILGLYTHYFMIFAVFSQAIYVFATHKKTHEKITEVKFLLKPLLLFIPWILFLFAQKPPFGGAFWIEKTTLVDLLMQPAVLYVGFEKNFSTSPLIFLMLVSAAIVYLFFRAYKGRSKLWYFFASWSLVGPLLIFLISLFKPIYFPRYLIFSTPGLILFVIFSLLNLPKKTKVAIIAGTLLILFVLTPRLLNSARKADMRKTFSEIERLAKKTDVIYVSSELDYFTALYYVEEKDIYIYGKNYDEIPNYVGKVLIPKDRIKNTLPTFPSRAFIVRPDGQYDIQAAL